MWAVVVNSSHGLHAYEPFGDDQQPLARRFADFLTGEIGPAYIAPAAEVGKDVPRRNPLEELLTWRDLNETAPACRHSPDRRRLERIREVHADLVAEHKSGCGSRRAGLAHAIEALAEAWHGYEPADPYAPLGPDRPG